jgi:lipopolysaccharide biosynthesis protein
VIDFMNRIKAAYKVVRTEGIKSLLEKVEQKVIRKISRTAKIIPVSEIDRKYADVYMSSLQRTQQNASGNYVNLSDTDLSVEKLPIDLIAFYLPQFHPIPENDQWWGRGFTEWSNVPKAVPNFISHDQPRLPADLGFYDLRVPEILRQQAQLAKKFGLRGFCFYYYWFDGKKLLDSPIDHFANDTEIDFPFCLCWANENWTRRWDGLENDILIAQNHSPDSDRRFIADLEPYLMNKNYLRWKNKPVVLVYRPLQLPDPKATAERWRDYCREQGVGEIYLIAVQTPGVENPYTIGFDAVVEFPPHGIPPIPSINNELQILNPDFEGSVFRYQDVSSAMASKEIPFSPYIRGLFLSWDNTARMQNRPLIFHENTPVEYGNWLTRICNQTISSPNHFPKMVFINAWNEWAEGTYLEPDRKWGYAYLQKTADVISGLKVKVQAVPGIPKTILPSTFHRKNDIAIILHLYYTEFWAEIKDYLSNLDGKFDLFVSIPESATEITSDILSAYPDTVVYHCPNRGRDIAPFIAFLNEIKDLGYSYICKLHSKKSTHLDDGAKWRSELYSELLGSTEQIEKILGKLSQPEIGMICPNGSLLSTREYIGGNQDLLITLAHLLHLSYSGEYFNFSGGSMFWCKPEAIVRICDLNLMATDFPEEKGQIDGTIAHAIERFLGFLVMSNQLKLVDSKVFSEATEANFPYAEPLIYS